MAATQIDQFALGWHPQHGCHFRVKLHASTWGPWTKVSPADLAALAAIFKEHPVFLHPGGAITTGPEPVGE